MEELCGSRVFRITGKRFLVLTMSLQEYEYYITQIKKRFETDMQLDADSSKPATPVILSGIVHGPVSYTHLDVYKRQLTGHSRSWDSIIMLVILS